MNRQKSLIKISLFILLILLGIFMFIFGEYDDSPGGQILGLIMAIIGIVGIIKTRRKISSTNKA